MPNQEYERKYVPRKEALGKPCAFWDLKGRFVGCNYPSLAIEGRISCEGVIDDICLWRTCGIRPKGLTEQQIIEIKLTPPSLEKNRMLPAGSVQGDIPIDSKLV